MSPTKNPIDVHVGRQVRMRRTLIGMSQTELATQLGITFQQVQKYEKGINRIGASRLYDIARVLSVPPSHFFQGLEGEPEAPGGPAPTEEDLRTLEALQTIATRQGVELNRAFMRIENKRIRKLLIDLADAIVTGRAGSGDLLAAKAKTDADDT